MSRVRVRVRALVEDREVSMADADARLEQLRERFASADTANKGALDRDALRNLLECTETFCLTQHWLPDEVLDAVMAKYDRDNNGTIDFDEFLILAKDKVMLEGKLEEFDAAFKAVAGDADEITAKQLQKLFEGLGDPKSDGEMTEILSKYDKDGNGKIDFAEFLEMARTHTVELNSVVEYVTMDGGDSKAAEEQKKGGSAKAESGGGMKWPWQSKETKKERPADTPPVTEVKSKAEFLAIVEAESPNLVVLEVAFTWCRPCKGFTRKFERFAGHYTSPRFVKIFGNENDDTKAFVKHDLKVQASPAFYTFRLSEDHPDALDPVSSWTGANEDRFRTNLNEALDDSEKP